MMRKIVITPLIILFLFPLNLLLAETIYTYRSKESPTDNRRDYNKAVLELALKKTIKQYGPYKLIPSNSMNAARSENVAKNGKLENFFVILSVSSERLSEMNAVNFPIDRGIVGYRVFFVSPTMRLKLKNITTLEELKNFTILQGIGWLDIKILQNSGFKVITGSTYEGLFEMVARGRGDLFPRGANELLREYVSHKHIKDLIYDDSIILYYNLPRFFFTSKKNKVAARRVEDGIIAAYSDGSFNELWESYYHQSIKFADLKNRRIIKIDNPFLKGVNNSYQKYIYLP